VVKKVTADVDLVGEGVKKVVVSVDLASEGAEEVTMLTDKRRIPLRPASVRTPHLFHHRIPKVLVNPRSKGITSVRSTFTL
jgi:hypothetical protein